MSTLQNKIDFVALVTAERANPNGDPLNGNRPRVTSEGYGMISDVCIKRKIRNRLQDMGERIFVQSGERADDGYGSLSDRARGELSGCGSNDEYAEAACGKWIDVRTFGQVFAFKAKDNKKGSGDSVPVRGPVTIHQAMSVNSIDVDSIQITKSVNSESTEGGKKSSDTMGSKHMVNFGLYKIKGSINVQLAEKTGFSEEDAEKIKECLRTLFVNDCSSARPDGSMTVEKLYWWTHSSKIGQYSSKRVHDSLRVELNDGVTYPHSIDDFTITLEELDGLSVEVVDGI
ncbi:MAG: type I-C CRISPR-associated protein Cas7/Csd2 [Ruminococcus sp.]|nr:type I-C CRISPR-associated protein Cas7/Csd2 [Ruminococcus sp.]